MSSSTLPSPRRIITAHSPSGTPICIGETIPATTAQSKEISARLLLLPSRNSLHPTEALDDRDTKIRSLGQANGVTVHWVDTPPGQTGIMHLTESIDFVILTHGVVEVEQPDGRKTRMHAGDLLLQLGDVYQINNVGTEWARSIAVVLGARPVVVEGKSLSERFGDPKLDRISHAS